MKKWDPSKWEIHRLYAGHSKFRKRMPPTSVLSRSTLKKFINLYPSVYIKGKNEHTGFGIIKAWKTKDGYRYVKVKGEPESANTLEELYEKVKDGRKSRSVLVQKAIDLAEIEGRPFSVRVMLMRDGRKNWRYAGMLAKVAGDDSVVTNVRRGGGYAATIEQALSKALGYNRKKIESMKKRLIGLSYQLIRYAASKYKTYETGLDIGIDKQGRIWIIEVNLAYPSYGLFNRLEDKTYYRKIKSLAEEYKRRHR